MVEHINEIAGVVVTAVLTSLAVGEFRRGIAHLEYFRAQFPMIAPLVGSLLVSILHTIQPDILTGAITIATNKFSFVRQCHRWLGALITVGLGASLAVTGLCAEIGMTIGKFVGTAISTIIPGSKAPEKSSSTSKNFALLQSIIIAGAAAGVGANNDAPITGMVYAIEVPQIQNL